MDEPGMAYIPGGRRQSQVPADDDEPSDVPAFWVDKYEVTVEQYRACVDAGACTPPDEPQPSSQWVCTYYVDNGAKLPVNCVHGLLQDEYCAWAKKRAPMNYEWMWAAGSREERRRYVWGDKMRGCDASIIHIGRRDGGALDGYTPTADDAAVGCGRGRPWPGGSRSPDVTRDGVYDMGGNVAEFVVVPINDHGKFRALRKDETPPRGVSERPQQTCSVASWATGPFNLGTRCIESNALDASETSGFRCAKDLGALPPCTVAP
jgi:formylglycine-generating enzyme required for sulfatase activity